MIKMKISLLVAGMALCAMSVPAFGLISAGESAWGNEGAELDDGGAWWSFGNEPSTVIQVNGTPPNETLELSHGQAGPPGNDGVQVFSGPDTFWDLGQGHNGNGQFAMDLRIKSNVSSTGGTTNSVDYLGPAVGFNLPSGTQGSADRADFHIQFSDARGGQNPDNSDALTVRSTDTVNVVDFVDGLPVDWQNWNHVRIVGAGVEGSDQRIKVYVNADPTPLINTLVSVNVQGSGGDADGGIVIGALQPRITNGSSAGFLEFDFIRALRTLGGTDADGLPLDGPPLPIPEPATLGLVALGAATMFMRRRRAD